MSLEFYRWFFRDVMRLPDKAAWSRANRREIERKMELKRRKRERRHPEDDTGLPEGRERFQGFGGEVWGTHAAVDPGRIQIVPCEGQERGILGRLWDRLQGKTRSSGGFTNA